MIYVKILSLFILIFFQSHKAIADADKAIVIPVFNWSSQIVGAYVIGKILEKNGNKVKYEWSESLSAYSEMCKGRAHLTHEMWQAFEEQVNIDLDQGCIEIVALTDTFSEEGWWVPQFTIDMCPDLPNYKALNSCRELRGIFHDGPVVWHGDYYNNLIKDLNLNFKINYASDADELWWRIAKAEKDNQGIVIFNWTPNFTDAVYKGQMIEFPDPYRKRIQFKTVVWQGFKKSWPDAYNVLKKINFSNMDVSKMAAMVDVDGLSHEQAAQKWINANSDKISSWLDPNAKVEIKKPSITIEPFDKPEF